MFLDWTYRTKGFEASALDVYKVDSLLALADKYDCPALISDLCNVLNQRIRKSDAAINLEPYYIAVKHSLPIVSQFDQVVALTKQSIYEKAIAIIAVYDPKLPSDSKD